MLGRTFDHHFLSFFFFFWTRLDCLRYILRHANPCLYHQNLLNIVTESDRCPKCKGVAASARLLLVCPLPFFSSFGCPYQVINIVICVRDANLKPHPYHAVASSRSVCSILSRPGPVLLTRVMYTLSYIISYYFRVCIYPMAIRTGSWQKQNKKKKV